ncbi:MAG: hypothetical protein JXA07_05920 [Spirochaetes bacterium]|nr:hypothetical protein [Spirochaetota bacterium]
MKTQMWTLSRHFWIFFLVLLLPGLVMLGIGITTPGARTNDGHSLLTFGAAYTGILLLVEGGTFIFLRRQKRRVEYFTACGIRGIATILDAETTGVELNDMPQVELKLEVSIQGRAPYTITHRGYWNLLSLSSLKRGARLSVRVDPKNREKIMFVEEDTD